MKEKISIIWDLVGGVFVYEHEFAFQGDTVSAVVSVTVKTAFAVDVELALRNLNIEILSSTRSADKTRHRFAVRKVRECIDLKLFFLKDLKKQLERSIQSLNSEVKAELAQATI